MTETPELPKLPSFPEKKRRVGWWLMAAAVALGAVTIAIVVANAGPSVTASRGLEKLLLSGAEFPAGYESSVLTQTELNQADQTEDLPDDLQPAECADLLESQPQPTGDYGVGAVQAKNTSTNTFYVDLVTPLEGIGDWDTTRIDELLAACGNTTFSQDGVSGTITFGEIPRIHGDGFALRIEISAQDTTLTLGVAATKVADHVVVFTGGTSGDFDEAEFVQLANAANDKALAEL